MSRKNIAFTAEGRCILVAHGEEAPTDAEWAEYLGFVTLQGVERTQVLVWSAGGGPRRKQLGDLARLIAGRVVPVAVLSPHWRVRANVTVLSWFHRGAKAFPPTRLRDAIAFLEIPPRRGDLIERELHNLRLELDGGLGAP